jgi:hypothetical protein
MRSGSTIGRPACGGFEMVTRDKPSHVELMAPEGSPHPRQQFNRGTGWPTTINCRSCSNHPMLTSDELVIFVSRITAPGYSDEWSP